MGHPAYGGENRFFFRDTDRQIVGSHSGTTYRIGIRVHVLLDRIDRQQRRLQFALIPDAVEAPVKRARRSKTASSPTGERPHSSPKRTGKKKARVKAKRAKGKKR